LPKTKSPGSRKSKTPRVDIAAEGRRLLGFSSLRPGQREAIEALLDRKDVLVVQPTGSGKSAIYQIAGELMGGSTVIVSPLIALQKDQADSIEAERKLKDPVVVNSTLPAAAQRETMHRIEDGKAQYIFLAPEQLRKPETVQHLESAGISLFVVDEAHCVSQWGHDFRPDYLQISTAIEAVGHPPVLAMTATAASQVRQEIVELLGLRSPKLLVQSFDRPNISLRVDTFGTEDEKLEAVMRRVAYAETPGIVYVATHNHAESIAEELRQRGVDAVCYHGGMKASDRNSIQDRFMRGDVPVIVATNAFGMGVDKPDIRFVYHADVSESLDSYYQEIGRAGRDGKPAEAVLFFRPGDIGSQKYKTGSGSVDTQRVQEVMRLLTEDRQPIAPAELAKRAGLSARKLIHLLQTLEEVGAAERMPNGNIRISTHNSSDQIAAEITEQQERLKELRKARLEQMKTYAEYRGCRREVLLRYFGDDAPSNCGNCDNCEAAVVSIAA
jgi:ATP-dependent DNA helicase RecQ